MSNNGKIQTINPATGKVSSSYDITSIEQIECIARNAQNAFEKWGRRKLRSAVITFDTWPKYSLRIITDIPKSL
ncbi:MAG TPA: hypothetical protein VFI73_08575 [Candidatus Nitrosopolaris sp.]|nr:hypothetical protein [Candidatus Nitrosopolaris sp.]